MNYIGPKAYIHVDRLKRNLSKIQIHVGDRKLMCVVKANGYGHGAVEVANAIKDTPNVSFAVFAIEEALELRNNGIQNEIMVFCRMQPEFIPISLKYDLTLNVSSLDDLATIHNYNSSEGVYPNFHLKFDTGMTRLGFDISQKKTIFNYLLETDLKPEGIYTHFSTADEGDITYAETQLNQFNSTLKYAKNLGFEFTYVHSANSGAILNLPSSYFNLIRVGMLLYGVPPSDEVPMDINVEPVMSFCGPIINVRRVSKGTQVSYGGVYETKKDTTIAVVQTGFADGFPRPWFENGYVGYKGEYYKIAGRVCMDQLMVDFGDVSPKEGEDVLFFGSKDGNTIQVETIANEINTTPYVLLTAIHGRTKRLITG